mgnify:CR=1 FL=1
MQSPVGWPRTSGLVWIPMKKFFIRFRKIKISVQLSPSINIACFDRNGMLIIVHVLFLPIEITPKVTSLFITNHRKILITKIQTGYFYPRNLFSVLLDAPE